MATFKKTKSGWQAQVFKRGVRKAATRDTKAQAKEWAAQVESEIASGSGIDSPSSKTLREAFDRYALEVSPKRKGARWEITRLRLLSRYPLADIRFDEVNASHIADWRDQRLSEVAASSVNRELNIISAVFGIAQTEWLWCSRNPVKEIKRPTNPKPRDRRISESEIERICIALQFEWKPPEQKQQQVALIFLLAIETAMRLGEIISLDHSQVFIKQRYVTLLDTKNGDKRDVPLSKRAIELLELIPKGKGALFSVTTASASQLFRKATKRAEIKNLRFHDSRHEALTRLARKLDVLDLAKMVGHRDPKSLMIYYNPTASEIASRLD